MIRAKHTSILGAIAAFCLIAPVLAQDGPAAAGLAAAASTEAPNIGGRWEGSLSVQGLSLRIVFRVTDTPGGITALLDSPDQLQTGIPVSAVAVEGDAVAFEIEAIAGGYAGTLSEDGLTMTGTWSQAGMSLPLDLARGELVTGPPNRPQTPEPPFPYAVEEVSIDNLATSDVTLSCTLTIPSSPGPHPAALLISGSGAQDRDETLLEHRPFAVIADHLTRNAIAVLRCDDRGFGRSTGSFQNAVPADFATDAEAALAFLREHDAIDAARTGIIGHSEGGVTGPMVAARDPDLAFLVMMAGLGVPGDDLLVAQAVEIVRTMGAPGPVIDQARAANRMLVDAVMAAPDAVSAQATVKEIMLSQFALQGIDAAAADEAAGQQAERLGSVYMRALLNYDPAPILPEITAPVLAINGSKDTQVPAWQNLPALRELFADHPDATIVELEGLNHLFQTAETGAPGEYAEIEETFAPIALETISDWIAARMLSE